MADFLLKRWIWKAETYCMPSICFDSTIKISRENNCLIKYHFRKIWKCYHHHHICIKIQRRWNKNAIDRRKDIQGNKCGIHRTPYNLLPSCVVFPPSLMTNMTTFLYNFYRWTKKNRNETRTDSRSFLVVCMCVFCLLQKRDSLQLIKSVVRFKSLKIKCHPAREIICCIPLISLTTSHLFALLFIFLIILVEWFLFCFQRREGERGTGDGFSLNSNVR